MGKTLDDAPAGAYEVVRQRRLAAVNAAREFAVAVYGADPGAVLKAMPKAELQQAICELMMSGLSLNQVSEISGVAKSMISRWFSAEPVEMQKLMRQALTKDALIEMPKTWGVLKEARESENQETARKAALDCARAAGLHMDPGAGSAGAISIHAQNLQFNNLSTADLDRKILELAAKIGPDALQLAEIEVKGDGKARPPAQPSIPTA